MVMSESYVTLITTLTSAGVGGAVALVSVYLTNKGNTVRQDAQLAHQAKIGHAELLRDRGEELYELIDTWLNGLFGSYMIKASIMQGKLTYNEGLDIELKNGKANSGNYGRIQMLIDVYFPAVREQCDRVLSLREATNKHVILHKRAYERGETDGTAFLKAFTTDQLSLEAAAEKLKEAVIEQVRAA
jgi:hypothetical protein